MRLYGSREQGEGTFVVTEERGESQEDLTEETACELCDEGFVEEGGKPWGQVSEAVGTNIRGAQQIRKHPDISGV